MNNFAKRFCWQCVTLILIFSTMQCPFLEAAGLVIPKGILVRMRLEETLFAKTAKIGKLVKLTVDRPVLVGKKKIIEKGAPVQAYISEIRTQQDFGQNARLKIKFLSVSSVIKKEIPLEIGELSAKTNEQMGPAVTADDGTLIFGPMGLLSRIFTRGKSINIRKGTIIHAEISEGSLFGG